MAGVKRRNVRIGRARKGQRGRGGKRFNRYVGQRSLKGAAGQLTVHSYLLESIAARRINQEIAINRNTCKRAVHTALWSVDLCTCSMSYDLQVTAS